MVDWRRFRKHKTIEVQNHNEEMLGYINESTLYVSLEHNLQQIMQEFGNSPDVKIREFAIGNPGVRAAAVFIDNLTDKTIVDDFIMRSLMIDTAKEAIKDTASGKNVFEFIKNHAFVLGEVQVVKNWKGFMLSLLSGNTLILINGTNEAISGDTRGGKLRDPSEPTSQVVIRGPKDGFTENLVTNVSLIRRRIKSPHLWLESKSIGSVTQTTVAIMYIQGIANDQLVQEVRQRLNGIRIDGILESGYIEELIQDQPFSPFPTIYSTERPDAVAANLLEGRIAVLVDGTPFVLVLPSYAAMIIAADLFQLMKPQKLALPIGITILLSSMMTAGSWTEFEQEGKQVIIGVFLPLLSIIIPVLLLVVHLIRKRFGLY
ncbi:spore germination protein [Paenibacillus sp. 32352]|uniref:spore germination protein n=1 Tax=Paenibacillus sp. 32352 TaxID=1969111 RepID=UPI0009AF1D3B|nr:spore germination protein [Paenibacillus sp. 32352]